MEQANIAVDKIFEYLARKPKEEILFGMIIQELRIDCYGANESLYYEIIAVLHEAHTFGLLHEFSADNSFGGTIQINKSGADAINAYGSYSKYISHLIEVQKEKNRIGELSNEKLKLDVELNRNVVRDYPTTRTRSKYAFWISIASLILGLAGFLLGLWPHLSSMIKRLK